MTTTKESIYRTLSKIDVSKFIKKKMGLNYLSWATAWGLVLSHYPDAQKEITEYDEYVPTKEGWQPTGRKVDYRLTPFGCEVETTVSIGNVSRSQNLYVMDNRNRVVPTSKLDIAQINKAQQRCLVKTLALFGLGLNVYAGEDLPADEDEVPVKKQKSKKNQPKHQSPLNDISNKEALNYQVQYGGGMMTIAELFKSAVHGDKQAADFLKGAGLKTQKDKMIFEVIKERKLYLD